MLFSKELSDENDNWWKCRYHLSFKWNLSRSIGKSPLPGSHGIGQNITPLLSKLDSFWDLCLCDRFTTNSCEHISLI